MQKREGVVARYGSRGFGFLTDTATRVEYFFHINDVIGFITLRAGDRVRFAPAPPREGSRPTAMQVELVPAETVK